jgi:hypothetical protein
MERVDVPADPPVLAGLIAVIRGDDDRDVVVDSAPLQSVDQPRDGVVRRSQLGVVVVHDVGDVGLAPVPLADARLGKYVGSGQHAGVGCVARGAAVEIGSTVEAVDGVELEAAVEGSCGLACAVQRLGQGLDVPATKGRRP